MLKLLQVWFFAPCPVCSALLVSGRWCGRAELMPCREEGVLGSARAPSACAALLCSHKGPSLWWRSPWWNRLREPSAQTSLLMCRVFINQSREKTWNKKSHLRRTSNPTLPYLPKQFHALVGPCLWSTPGFKLCWVHIKLSLLLKRPSERCYTKGGRWTMRWAWRFSDRLPALPFFGSSCLSPSLLPCLRRCPCLQAPGFG